MSSDVSEMLAAVRRMHEARGFREAGGEESGWRVALLAEEVGEIAAAVTKGGDLAAEHADLMIVLLGNCVAFGIDIEEAFWRKMRELEQRPTLHHAGHARMGK